MRQKIQGVHESTFQQQTAMEVTVYNNNRGLVKDQRQIKLPKGLIELRFMDIAANIEVSSIHLHSITTPDKLSILEQNCEYEYIEPDKLLAKYIGKEVSIYRRNHLKDQVELMTATILYSGQDNIIYQSGDEIIMSLPSQIIFPKVSETIKTKPTITWLIYNDNPSLQTIETVYIARGLNWNADYRIVLNQEDSKADIFAWADIENGSRLDYSDTTIKLVAGDVNHLPYYDDTAGTEYSLGHKPISFKGKSFADNHIYSMDRHTTLKNGQTKQIGLLQANDVKIKKEYRLSSPELTDEISYGRIFARSSEDVTIYLTIDNKKSHGLGIPLPEGNVHVFKRDNNDSLQFIGADKIGHIPENETASVKLGSAFDIRATRTQKDFQQISQNIHEITYEINIRNHKKEDVTVRILENIASNWIILESSHKLKRIDSRWVECPFHVKSGKEMTLTYKVRTGEE